jgi:hypothetical protein
MAGGLMLIAAVALPTAMSPAQEVGDFPEYYRYASAFIDHGAPDSREADELAYGWAALFERGVALERGIPVSASQSGGAGLLFKTDDGTVYPYHFWLSSLAVAPLGWVMKTLGLPWLRAFAIANGLLMVAAFYALLVWLEVSLGARRTLAAVWVLSPVTWYVGWPSAEVWSASFVVLSFVLLTRERYFGSVFLSACAAAQNPPLLVYVGLVCAIGAWKSVQLGRLRRAGVLAVAAIPAILPNVFFLTVYGVANPIVAHGEAGPEFITLQRMSSFYLDLNQGMLMYAPFAVLWLPSLYVTIRGRAWLPVALSATCLVMTLLSAMGGDWCSGCVGIMRWAVWQLPLIAFAAVLGFRCARERIAQLACPAMVGVQAAVAVLVVAWPAYAPSHLAHGPAAQFVLSRWPALYSPEPDIFFDRTMGFEVSNSLTNPRAIPTEAAVYRDKEQTPRKALVPDGAVAVTSAALGYSEEVIRSAMYPAGRAGLFYVDLPLLAGARPHTSTAR